LRIIEEIPTEIAAISRVGPGQNLDVSPIVTRALTSIVPELRGVLLLQFKAATEHFLARYGPSLVSLGPITGDNQIAALALIGSGSRFQEEVTLIWTTLSALTSWSSSDLATSSELHFLTLVHLTRSSCFEPLMGLFRMTVKSLVLLLQPLLQAAGGPLDTPQRVYDILYQMACSCCGIFTELLSVSTVVIDTDSGISIDATPSEKRRMREEDARIATAAAHRLFFAIIEAWDSVLSSAGGLGAWREQLKAMITCGPNGVCWWSVERHVHSHLCIESICNQNDASSSPLLVSLADLTSVYIEKHSVRQCEVRCIYFMLKLSDSSSSNSIRCMNAPEGCPVRRYTDLF
jgi:hypothetical protein